MLLAGKGLVFGNMAAMRPKSRHRRHGQVHEAQANADRRAGEPLFAIA